MKKIKLPQKAWFGDGELEIYFPPAWDVTIHDIPADKLPVISIDDLSRAINKPIGCEPLSVLARNRNEVAIIFDDLSRPTPVDKVLPLLLDELHSAGISDDKIRFIVALGAHGAHTRSEFEKKLGTEIIKRYPVYNHNPYENCIYMGTTKQGTRVEINSEVAKCDLKIGIGSILPHPMNGFGGGGKIILPGIASMDSIEANHLLSSKKDDFPNKSWMGSLESNFMRRDLEEAASIAGLDFKIDLFVNSSREIVGMVTGDHIKAYNKGIEKAYSLYNTVKKEAMDVVIVNANAKINEAFIAAQLVASCVKKGGTLVLIVDSPIGQVCHYLLGPFGKKMGGRMHSSPYHLFEHLERVIILSQYPDYASGQWIAPHEKINWADSWDQVVNMLEENSNKTMHVSVYVDGTMQFFKE